MSAAKPMPTPMSSNIHLSKNKGEAFDNEKFYRSIVGALQYITITRPDLSFAVNKVCQFMQKPLDLHWKAVKHILRYLKGSTNQGLKLTECKDLSIRGFVDADWASDSDDRRSTTGYCIYLESNPVSWCSKKQPTVSRSSTEAEYRSVANTAAEIIWLRSLLKEIKVDSLHQPVIWCDNSGAVSISSNPVLHYRTKHIEIDLYFVREQVIKKELAVNHIPASHQIADVLTKALSKHNFERFKASLKIEDIESRSETKEEKRENPR